MPRKEVIIENIRLGKLVHGGQALGETENGKKVLVWGGLPGELVNVQITKKKSSYLEGIAVAVHVSSPDRIEPKEPPSYLSTSPWQIMKFGTENLAKQAILAESYDREGVKEIKWQEFISGDQEFGYRNKQEYGFWGDDDGLHLAHFVRGTHGKQMVQGSALAMECINEAARSVRDELNRLEIWAGDLKTVMLRANLKKQVVGALFIKKKSSDVNMSDFQLPKELKGLDIYYSDPMSPASVPTKRLYSFGDITLIDSISGKNIMYDVLSFFQVNLNTFDEALKAIKSKTEGAEHIVDMYSGVGTIGIGVGANTFVESDDANIKMAKENTKDTDIKVVKATSESALECVSSDDTLIVDPPRAGLHKHFIDHVIDVKPVKIIYLSCNPSTQARDIKILEEYYNISYAQGYNFFPRTPHIESLIVLDKR